MARKRSGARGRQVLFQLRDAVPVVASTCRSAGERFSALLVFATSGVLLAPASRLAAIPACGAGRR